jgi:hypothetical protein
MYLPPGLSSKTQMDWLGSFEGINIIPCKVVKNLVTAITLQKELLGELSA